jgi:tetratricopeptide (TPR) repeat protein
VRTANSSLQALLGETNWTQDLLARQVNALAGEIGLSIHLDRRTVSHWLAGRRPRAPLPDLIAEAFSRRLGRTVTAARLGLAEGEAAECCRDPKQDPLDALEQLARLTGAGRREAELCGAYSLADLAVHGWPAEDLFPPAARAAVGARLEPGQVAAAEAMAGLFADADDVFGGGHARAALGRYLAHDVVPRLRAPGTRRVRTRMCAVAVELTRLCALMCFDDERHALAQRYFTVALKLAVENEDPAAYAAVLRAMSVQAHALGHHAQALSLARAAIESVEGRALPDSERAGLHGQLAVAAAAHGDRDSALAALDRAGALLCAGRAPRPAAGCGYHPAAHAHQAAAVHTLLGDLPAGIKMLAESIRRGPARERRTRAIAHAQLAGMHLDQGHLDESIAACHAFIDDYPDLHSGRARSALRTLLARLRPHAAHHSARHLLARAATLSRSGTSSAAERR